MIEWKNDRTSVDGEWLISRDGKVGEPPWVYFERYPSEVVHYIEDHPGDTDAWLGHYAASVEEMHEQAERLLKIVAKSKRSKK